MKSPEQLEWTDELVKSFWDNQSGSAENYFTYKHAGNILKLAKPYMSQDAVVLDYGAGRGFLACEVAEKGYRIGAFDYSPESVKDLQQKLEVYDGFVEVHDGQGIESVCEKYDFVFLIEVIEHLTDEHIAETMKKIKTVLRPGGKFLLTTPFEEDLNKKQVYCPQCNKFFHMFQHVRSWGTESLSGCLRNNGFKVVDCFATDLNFYKMPAPEFLMQIKRGVYSIIRRKLKTPHLVAVVEKI